MIVHTFERFEESFEQEQLVTQWLIKNIIDLTALKVLYAMF